MSQISPDGQWKLDPATNSWVPNVAPPAPPPPPPAAAAPPPMPPVPPMPGVPPMPSMPPMPSYMPTGAPQMPAQTSMAGEVDFAAEAWSGSMPLADGLLVLIEDVEAGESAKGNDKITFSGKTVQANGDIAAGTKAVWAYYLTKDSRGKLFRDMLTCGITRGSTHPPILAQQLTATLRGQVLIVNSRPSRGSDLPDVSVMGLYKAGAQQPAPAQTAVAPQAPPPLPVSFPNPGAPGFSNV